MAPARIVVTGAEGFVGSALARELISKGHHVESLALENGVDVRDFDRVVSFMRRTRPEVVFHLAGVSNSMIYEDRPDIVTAINSVGTVNVLESVRRVGGSRVVLASSVAGYMSGDETCPLPMSVYGVTKRTVELLGATYRNEFNVSCTWIRIGAVYGPGRRMPSALDNMVRAAVEGHPIPYTVDAWSPLVHVEDAARLLALLVDVPRWRPFYDLVTTPATHRQLAVIVQDRFRPKPALVPLSAACPTWPVEFDISALLLDTGGKAQVSLVDGVAQLVVGRRQAQIADQRQTGDGVDGERTQ